MGSLCYWRKGSIFVSDTMIVKNNSYTTYKIVIVCNYFIISTWIHPVSYWQSSLVTYKRGGLRKGFRARLLQSLVGFLPLRLLSLNRSIAISLASYVALAKALGYGKAIKELLSEPLYSTMEELEVINKNKNRKKGRNEIGK